MGPKDDPKARINTYTVFETTEAIGGYLTTLTNHNNTFILILIVIVTIMIQKWNLYFYFCYDDHIYRPRIKEKKCIAVFTCAYRRHAVPSKYSWSNIKKCIAIFRLQRKSVSQKSESASQFANCDTLIRGLPKTKVTNIGYIYKIILI